MGKQRTPDELVKQGSKAEKRLLRKEQRAERLLAEARTKLDKARTRLERRLSAVSEAEGLLRTRQAARGAGPKGSNGTSAEAVPPTIESATEAIIRASEASTAADGQIIVAEDGAPSGAASETESPATLVLPPAVKPPVRRRAKKPAASKEQAS